MMREPQACLGSSPTAVALRPFVAEAGLVHLVFEMLVSARVTEGGFMPSLWLHHIASVVGFVTCLLTRNPTALLFATRLAVVECTTGLPVAFRQAKDNKKLKVGWGLGGRLLREREREDK